MVLRSAKHRSHPTFLSLAINLQATPASAAGEIGQASAHGWMCKNLFALHHSPCAASFKLTRMAVFLANFRTQARVLSKVCRGIPCPPKRQDSSKNSLFLSGKLLRAQHKAFPHRPSVAPLGTYHNSAKQHKTKNEKKGTLHVPTVILMQHPAVYGHSITTLIEHKRLRTTTWQVPV